MAAGDLFRCYFEIRIFNRRCRGIHITQAHMRRKKTMERNMKDNNAQTHVRNKQVDVFVVRWAQIPMLVSITDMCRNEDSHQHKPIERRRRRKKQMRTQRKHMDRSQVAEREKKNIHRFLNEIERGYARRCLFFLYLIAIYGSRKTQIFLVRNKHTKGIQKQ